MDHLHLIQIKNSVKKFKKIPVWCRSHIYGLHLGRAAGSGTASIRSPGGKNHLYFKAIL